MAAKKPKPKPKAKTKTKPRPKKPAWSLDEASARWIREGRALSSALNAYVQRIYEVGHEEAGVEPAETRKDLADYVREQLVALNAEGKFREARLLFPPAYEPFD